MSSNFLNRISLEINPVAVVVGSKSDVVIVRSVHVGFVAVDGLVVVLPRRQRQQQQPPVAALAAVVVVVAVADAAAAVVFVARLLPLEPVLGVATSWTRIHVQLLLSGYSSYEEVRSISSL